MRLREARCGGGGVREGGSREGGEGGEGGGDVGDGGRRGLVVGMTHLLWNPRRGWVKAKQAERLAERANVMSEGGRHAAVHAAVLLGCTPCALRLRPHAPMPARCSPTPPVGTSLYQSVPVRNPTPPRHAVVLLGDFNCAPASPLHRFLTSGHLRASLRCEGANPRPNQP